MKFLLLIYFVVIAAHGKSYIDEYCWRDYEGALPEDAVSGGIDSSGKLIYIGQVLFDGMLIPGKIFRNDKRIYFEWSNTENTSEDNIKVLCSTRASKFEWIQTSNDKFHLLHDKILIKGGYEPNYATYIGRIKTGETDDIGKIMCKEECLGLYTTKNGSLNLYTHYQVLAYNPMQPSNVIW